MLNSKLKRTSIALLLAVVLMLSLFPLTAFALEDAGAAPEGEAGVTLEEQTTDADQESAEKPEETKAETAAETSETAADDGHDHDEDTTTTGEKTGLSLGDIISLSLLGVVLILILVYCLTHKEKVGRLLRGLKSELKKIVWTPWKQVRKNTLVVLVVVIAAIICIYVVDFLFNQGIISLGKLF